MTSNKRILGAFAAAATICLGMAACEKKNAPLHTARHDTTEGTTVMIYRHGHLVRERIAENYMVGADFKQNIYFKSIIVGPDSHGAVSTTIQIPFADIKDPETLDQIARMRSFYEKDMNARTAPKSVPVPPAK
jgi:hypothetical protein